MNSTIPEARATARRALLLVLACAVAAWLLFVAGTYVDLLNTGVSVDYTTNPEPGRFELARYFIFAAVAVFGLGALAALRRTSHLRASGASTSLARPVQLFAGASLIVAAAISTLTCVVLFFDGFLGGGSSPAPLSQVTNLYLPIVLHTALVVSLMLAGFVFTPRPAEADHDRTLTTAPAAEPGGAAPLPDQATQRATALGFAVPVITAAAALIAGLIAADLTGSATQVWLWTIVLAVIGAGIVAGTRTAQHALEPQLSGQRPRGAAVGAKNLNFVLSIVLVGSAAVMSLGYGASAVSSLRSSPGLSVSVFDEGVDTASADGSLTWSANGSDLEPGSEISAVLQPGDIVLGTALVGRDGWADATGTLPPEDAPGKYTLEATAIADDGRAIETSVPFVRNDDGTLAEGGSADTYTDFPTHLTAMSARWVFSDLVPSGLLLLIAAAVVFMTITTRAREPRVESADN